MTTGSLSDFIFFILGSNHYFEQSWHPPSFSPPSDICLTPTLLGLSPPPKSISFPLHTFPSTLSPLIPSHFNCCHSQPLRKFKIITPTLYIMMHLPPLPISSSAPIKNLKDDSLKVGEYYFSPSFWGEDTMTINVHFII